MLLCCRIERGRDCMVGGRGARRCIILGRGRGNGRAVRGGRRLGCCGGGGGRGDVGIAARAPLSSRWLCETRGMGGLRDLWSARPDPYTCKPHAYVLAHPTMVWTALSHQPQNNTNLQPTISYKKLNEDNGYQRPYQLLQISRF